MSEWYDVQSEVPPRNPCKPYLSIEVIVFDKESEMVQIAYLSYNDRQWFKADSCGEKCDNVTHWHRIPELPLCTISTKSLS